MQHISLKGVTIQRTLKMKKSYRSISQLLAINKALIPITAVTQETLGAHLFPRNFAPEQHDPMRECEAPGQAERGDARAAAGQASSLTPPSREAVAKRQSAADICKILRLCPPQVPRPYSQTRHPTGHSVSLVALDNLAFRRKAAPVKEFREPYDSKNCR